MSEIYHTKSGSSNVINSDEVDLKICITRKNDSNKINLENGDYVVIDKKNFEKFILSGLNVRIRNPKNKKWLSLNEVEGKYKYCFSKVGVKKIQISIKGTRNPKFDNQSKIDIKFYKPKELVHELPFEIIADKQFSIKRFDAKKEIVEKGDNLILNFDILHEDKVGQITLSQDGQVIYEWIPNNDLGQPNIAGTYVKDITVFNDKNSSRFEIKFMDNKLSNSYTYELAISQQEKKLTKEISILYLDASKINSRLSPHSNDTKIVNICTSQEGNYLFALTKNKVDFQLWYTADLSGRDTWIEIILDDNHKLQSFAYSPMIHLISSEEKSNDLHLGQILFIGGSRLDTQFTVKADHVVKIPLEIEKPNRIEIKQMLAKNRNDKFSKIWGHSCVIFPKKLNNNTIWILGGQDRKGNTLNTIWTSNDGVQWTQEKEGIWPARCMASATVQLENDQPNAIWIGGGYDQIGGKSYNDVYKFTSNKWSKQDITLKDDLYNFGIGYGSKEKEESNGIYILEVYKNTDKTLRKTMNILEVGDDDKLSIEQDNKALDIIANFNQGCMTSTYFKGCWWFLSSEDIGEKVRVSKLYCRVPQITI